MRNRRIPALSASRNPLSLRDAFTNPSAFLLRLSCAAGDIGEFKAGPVHIICVNRPEWVHTILVEQASAFRKMPAVKTLRVFTGDGLLVSDGATWVKHRRLAAPAFHRQRILAYQSVAMRATQEMIAGWHDGQVIDLEHEMKRLTLTIVGRALFTRDVNEVADGLSRDVDRALDYVNGLSSRVTLPIIRSIARHDREALAAIARVDAAVRNLIRTRRAQAAPTADLLDMLLAARTEDGEALSDDEVRDEVITMFVAGHETVATVLTWLFYLVARHPEVQADLEREAREAQAVDRSPADEPFQRPYAMRVYKEAMRLYPGGFTIGRQAIQDVRLGDYVIPAGAWVMISPYSVHRNPAIFPSPERFDPERFTPENERALPRASYIPFGIGPRACIGGQFALMEGQVIVSTLAAQARLVNVTPGEVGIRPLVTLRPDRKIEMRVQKISPGRREGS
ncbi:MAG: cytochrome P450 [Thermoflexales bacterium]|nr:cytochrome P450 [Thermoflexales bacterium]MDW8351703.1 cytochrome P450 [Anaerolineae bacterium]